MEKERYEAAKRCIDSLANGLDPYTKEPLPRDSVLNDVNVVRVLFIASDALRRVIEGDIEKAKKVKKSDFAINDEQLANFAYSDKPIPITEIVKRLSDLTDIENMAKPKYKTIRDWLEQKGFLEIETDDEGKNKWLPTDEGMEMGITFESRVSAYGKPYKVTLYNNDAQHFIIDNLQGILNEITDDRELQEVDR